MFKIIYQNGRGSIRFFGGDACKNINLVSVEGVGLPTPEYQTVIFANENGVTQAGKRDLPRTVTMSGDVKGGRQERLRMNRVLHEDGELLFLFDGVQRKLNCKCTRPPEFVHQGGGIFSFTIQFQADYPYFTDFKQVHAPLYKTINNVTDTFTLPCVFTSRISRTDVLNNGDKYVYPTIYIEVTGASADAGTLQIINHTTGAQIKINRQFADGETVTVDLKTRRITSGTGGNITNAISDDTVLSAFYLQPGENNIEFISSVSGQTVNAAAVFDNEYYSLEGDVV